MKDIKGYEGLYAVTEDGQVWSYHSKKFLRTYDNGHGYHQVCLSKDGVSSRKRVHRLVAEAYIPNPENKSDVNHKDEDKSNNHVSNLEWATRAENVRHGSCRERSLAMRQKHYRVYCVELDKVYDTMNAAAAETGVKRNGIGYCCRGIQKTAGGYHWEYVEE